MTPPALTIEQLIDALVDKTWWCAQAGKSEVDAATADCKAARSALLAAIRSQVPADLAGLLREQADALAVLDSIRIDDDGRWATSDEVDRVAVVTKRITEWTRANLKETP